MIVNKKLLPLEEQTMLLISLLFARKHLDEILSFLPDQQSARMHEAKERFLKLEQSERITQIILELRRVLLIKEHTIRWIHESWIEAELQKEPPYIRTVIEQALKEKGHDDQNDSILQSFLAPFLRTPQKIALFDPVLMRLQSLNRTNQDQAITQIGLFALSALSHALHKGRFQKFIRRSYANNIELITDYPGPEDNPMAFAPIKNILMSKIFERKLRDVSMLAQECGLLIMAMYISRLKPRWHRMIELVLARPHGLQLRAMIEALNKNNYQEETKNITLASLLIDALEGAFS